MKPSRYLQIKAATELAHEFSGHTPQFVDTIKEEDYKTLMKIGELDGVLYSAKRDGKIEKYIHKFKRSSRPQLACSFDGKRLYILGGGYSFTNRGIVDH